VLSELSGDPAITHGQRLPGELLRALNAAGARLDDVDLLAVAAGPGSFTGLRVGLATMQGLAFARGLQVVTVSTFEAMARETLGRAADALIAPWIDAQRGEVFATLYAPGLGTVLAPASSAPPLDTLLNWQTALGSHRVVFVGDGAVRYRAAIEAALGNRARIVEPVPLLAGAIGRIAASEPHRAVAPHAVIPIYVRRPDAELSRDRSASR
jgi:tRNA threonylcarbamoyladenosine biosynthesis protein TsaB